MVEDEMIELLKKISDDIGEIKKFARFQARDAICTLLNKIAKTSERQQMWRLADGTLSNEQIADQIGVTVRSVQYFVQDAENERLIITEKRGYPKRAMDIIPLEWKPWKPKRVKVQPQPEPQQTAITEEEPDVKG